MLDQSFFSAHVVTCALRLNTCCRKYGYTTLNTSAGVMWYYMACSYQSISTEAFSIELSSSWAGYQLYALKKEKKEEKKRSDSKEISIDEMVETIRHFSKDSISLQFIAKPSCLHQRKVGYNKKIWFFYRSHLQVSPRCHGHDLW